MILQKRQSEFTGPKATLAGVAEDRIGDELVQSFTRWAARERSSAAAAEKARQHWLAERAASSATFTGILVDLAEQAAGVTMATGGFKCSGRVVGVGRDFCVLGQASGRPAVIPLAAISTIWPHQQRRLPPSGDRPPALEMSIVGAFAAMAEDRLPVGLRAGSHVIEGDVISVGDDVVTLRTWAPGFHMAHVPLVAVSFCEVR
jgi:hypothetical protein